jgi:3-hydroxybutyryl-CoA dehydratase
MLNALVAMDLPGAGTVFMSQTLSYKAPTYLGDTLTAEVEVLSRGTVVLDGECWTYTLRPA